MAPRRCTNVSPEEAERLKKQRERMRLYRAKIKEKQKQTEIIVEPTESLTKSHPSASRRQPDVTVMVPPPTPAHQPVTSPSKAIPNEIEVFKRIQEANIIMQGWQANTSYSILNSTFGSRPNRKEAMAMEALRRVKQRERQRRYRDRLKDARERHAATTTTTMAAQVGNGSLSPPSHEESEIQIIEEEDDCNNHKILRAYLQRARDMKQSTDNGHRPPSPIQQPAMCEYFESPNVKMLPKRRKGPKPPSRHEQIEPNVTLLEASDGTLVPLRAAHHEYQEFDDLMEIELVELGNLDKQTQTVEAWNSDKEAELTCLRRENENLKRQLEVLQDKYDSR